jgi:hypothetical protein
MTDEKSVQVDGIEVFYTVDAASGGKVFHIISSAEHSYSADFEGLFDKFGQRQHQYAVADGAGLNYQGTVREPAGVSLSGREHIQYIFFFIH